MRLTLEYTEFEEGMKVIIEQASDEQNISEMLDIIFAGLVGVGYHPDTIKEGFKEFSDETSKQTN